MKIIYDNILNMSYVEIIPFKAVFTDKVDSTRLYVVIQDNLSCDAQVTYHFTDNESNYTATGQLTIGQDNYGTWNGNNEYPFEFVINNLPVKTL